MITYPFNINDSFYLHVHRDSYDPFEESQEFEEYQVSITNKDIPNDDISFNFSMIKNNEIFKMFPLSYKINQILSLTAPNGNWKVSKYIHNQIPNILDEELFTL